MTKHLLVLFFCLFLVMIGFGKARLSWNQRCAFWNVLFAGDDHHRTERRSRGGRTLHDSYLS